MNERLGSSQRELRSDAPRVAGGSLGETCFLQRYAAGESYANCDQSTAEPVPNVADFTCFLQTYAAGCP